MAVLQDREVLGISNPSIAKPEDPFTYPSRASAPQNPSRINVPAPGNGRQTPSRPMLGIREPSIGIRRITSAQSLRSVAADPNVATGAPLQQTSSRLPALDENCVLEPAVSTPTVSSIAAQDQPEKTTSRLKRASAALGSKLGLKKDEEKEVEGGDAPEVLAAQSRVMAPNYVDVLDTIGMSALKRPLDIVNNRHRPGSPDTHISYQRPELTLCP